MFNTTEIRPWGSFTILEQGSTNWVKILEVKPLQKLSYQYHQNRTEVWTIIEGSGIATVDGARIYLAKGSVVKIDPLSKHRMENPSADKLVFIEVAFSNIENGVTEDDIIRMEDDYGRTANV